MSFPDSDKGILILHEPVCNGVVLESARPVERHDRYD